MRFSRALVSFILLFVLSWPALSQPKSAPKDDGATTTSVRAFVQKFYDWYLKTTLANKGIAPWSLLVDKPPASLSPELISALKIDVEAQKKVKDDNVGLDFDPFLNSQDPCDRYVAGKVSSQAEHYLVEVNCAQRGRKESKPDVVADIIQKDGQWLIVNFRYLGSDGDSDMLTMLKLLREERKKDTH
jgi:hypothetical protein